MEFLQFTIIYLSLVFGCLGIGSFIYFKIMSKKNQEYAKKAVKEGNELFLKETKERYEFLSLLGKQDAILDKLNSKESIK